MEFDSESTSVNNAAVNRKYFIQSFIWTLDASFRKHKRGLHEINMDFLIVPVKLKVNEQRWLAFEQGSKRINNPQARSKLSVGQYCSKEQKLSRDLIRMLTSAYNLTVYDKLL